MTDVKRQTRRGLTTDAVIAAAMAIVDTEGVEALTIRRLAGDCGVSAMAVYRHVRDKDELLDRVVDEVAAQIRDVPPGGAWQDRLAALFREARRALLDHPGVALVAITRSTPVPAVARFYDRVLAILDEAGWAEPNDAVMAFDALLMFLFGSVLWQTPRKPSERARLIRLAGMFDEPTPHLLAHAERLARRNPDRYFEYGLGVIIAGLTAPAPA